MAEREPNGPKRNTLRDSVASAIKPLIPEKAHALVVILVPDDVVPNAMDAHFVLAGGDIAMMRAAMRQWLSSPTGEGGKDNA